MSFSRSTFWVAGFLASQILYAQNAKPDPDVVVLVDDEKLVGPFEQADGTSLKFKSDIVGEVTIDWSKVKELHTSKKYAVIPKGAELHRNSDLSTIPQGTIAAADQKVTVTPAAGTPQPVNIADTDHVIEQTSFENAVHRNPGLFHDWGGTITIGASLVQATQESRNFTGALNLIQTVPDEDWLRRRSRTTLNLSAAYGTLSQPDTPTIKTQIYLGTVERDEYFTNTVYAFVGAAFQHNFSQGLDLQQTYGGGVGWSVLKQSNQTLDLKAGVTYVRQQFAGATASENLIGSVFEEDYTRGLWHGSKFNEQIIILPTWNNTDAISAAGNALITIPVYKRMNFSFGVIDNYLNNPPPAFKKNSFQLTMGLTYALR
jgi:hypothetical protein